jgi:hypothetical protein
MHNIYTISVNLHPCPVVNPNLGKGRGRDRDRASFESSWQ